MIRDTPAEGDTAGGGLAARRSPALPLLVFLAAVAGFVRDYWTLCGFPLDDAWIHRVYSRSFAFLRGFEYNSGAPEAGVTSPLWVMVSAPAHWLEAAGTDAVTVAVKALGVALGATAVLSAWRIARRLTASPTSAAVAAAVFALEPRLLFSALSGMEPVLVVTLWLTAVDALLSSRWRTAWILTGLLPLARPETAVVVPWLAAAIWWRRRRQPREPRGRFAWIAALVPSLVWLASCEAITGHWLPNTFYVKARPFELDLAIAWKALAQQGLSSLMIYPLGLLLAVARGLRQRGPERISLLPLVAAPATFLVAVTGSRAMILDGYVWTRWVDPAAIVLDLAFAIGLASLAAGRWPRIPELRLAGTVLKTPPAAVAALAVAISLPAYAETFGHGRRHLSSDSRAVHLINVRTGEWIARNTPETATVGVNDAGAIRYFGGRHTVDLIGLNHADIAFGRVTVADAILELDYLAIFPFWFRRGRVLALIDEHFEERAEITIPEEEYTLCACSEQSTKVIFARRSSPLSPATRR